MQLISAIAAARREYVASKTLAVHTNERRILFVYLAFHQCEVMLPI